MSTERSVFIGRKAELATLAEFTGHPALVAVRGDGGLGKTALLEVARRNAVDRGIGLVRIRFEAGQHHWDLFGAAATIAGFREEFDVIGNSRVAAVMTSAGRLCRPETYRSPLARGRLLAELERLFGYLGNGTGRAVVLIDDVHLAPDPALAVAAGYRSGCTVIAACREDGVTAEPTTVSALADQVLDLRPVSDGEIDEMLAAAARGVPLDSAVTPALRTALGSLAGNPGAVLTTFEALRRAGRIVRVQEHLCLADPDGSVLLPAGHELVRFVAGFGDAGRHLLAVVARSDRFRLDDLPCFAAATGRDIDSCGRLVDRFVAAGALDCDEWGTLSIPCPALVAAVCEGQEPADVPGVHRAIAEHLLRDGTSATEPAVLADHVALAGVAMPRNALLVAVLENEAADVLGRKPVLAARWYRAALHHCAPGSPVRTRILGQLCRLLTRIGHYRCLGEVVADAVRVGFADRQRTTLAASAALAAICTGVPVPGPVSDALAGDPASRAPLEFCARWFTDPEGDPGIDLNVAFAPLRDDHAPIEDAEVAGDWHDVSAMFKVTLGAAFGEPLTGPLATYAKLRRGYLDGDWAEIPSDARALELSGASQPAIHPLARLLTAEVLSCQGDGRGAARWLDLAAADRAYPITCAWVEMGILARAGEPDRARALGWAVCERIAAGAPRPGLPWLLVRLGYLELRAGGTEQLGRLCAEAKRWHAEHGGVQLWVAELMLRGMAERDHAAAVTAVEILRKHGAVPALASACVVVALLDDDPKPWLHEAYDIARRLGDDWLRMSVKAYMVSNGVSPPRYRRARANLSTLEQSIIALIQRGLTNRQIAAAVRAGEKTIENHLTRLFAKTGCRSRLDLATASLEGRLVLARHDDTGSAGEEVAPTWHTT